MNTEPDNREAAREAGEKYGIMAAELCLIHVSMASNDDAIHDHIEDLARNISERAAQQANGLGEDLAAIWKEAALKAAQARLETFGEPEEPEPSNDTQGGA